jgi:peroxiredoxin
MTKKSIYLYIAAVVLLIVFGYSYFSNGDETPKATAAGFDTKTLPVAAKQTSYPVAPDFKLQDLNGKEVKLSDQKGKVVIIDFWATWCPPCRKGIPEFVELQNEYGADKLVILGISVDQDEASVVRNFAQSYQINYPVLFYTPDVISAYGGIEGIPTTFIVDKQGRVRQRVVGYQPKMYFTQMINSLL